MMNKYNMLQCDNPQQMYKKQTAKHFIWYDIMPSNLKKNHSSLRSGTNRDTVVAVSTLCPEKKSQRFFQHIFDKP